MHAFAAAFGAAILVAAAVMPAHAASQSADARFVALYTKEWAWRVEQFGQQDSKSVDAHLPKVDPATQAMREAYWENVMKELDAIPRAELSVSEQINYDVYRPQIAALIADQKFRTYEMPANSDSAFWSGFECDHCREAKDYRNWISQISDIPRYFS